MNTPFANDDPNKQSPSLCFGLRCRSYVSVCFDRRTVRAAAASPSWIRPKDRRGTFKEDLRFVTRIASTTTTIPYLLDQSIIVGGDDAMRSAPIRANLFFRLSPAP
eukprot:scaffold220_cov169-Amphora_coffeaeformis.AAC.19